MSSMSRIIEDKIDTLEIELLSTIAKIKDECVWKIDAWKPKSSNSPNVDEGDINLLQDDASNLEAKLNSLEEDELKEGIDTVNWENYWIKWRPF